MPTVQNTTQEQPGLAQTLKMETFIALANCFKHSILDVDRGPGYVSTKIDKQ